MRPHHGRIRGVRGSQCDSLRRDAGIDADRLEFYNVGAASPFQVASLGKPSPDAGGIIRVQLTSVLTSLPSPGIVYEARVAAVGPAAWPRTPSNTFSFFVPAVQFRDFAHQSNDCPGRRNRKGDGDGGRRMWMDGCQQRRMDFDYCRQ